MAVEARRRSRLYEGLAEALGHDEAATMFELLPPSGVDTATTGDIDRLDRRFDSLEQRMDDRFEAAQRQMDDRFASLSQRMDDRDGALDRRMDDRHAALRADLVAVFRGELAAAVVGQTRAVTIASVSTALSVSAAALALARLL
jgi:hypothetical protein